MHRRESLSLITALGLYPFMSGFSPDEKIATRSIPKTGEKLPVVGVGTWETFDVDGSHKDMRLLKELFEVFVRKGAKVVDSSPMYGFAERNVGNISAELEINDKLFIATKVWTKGKDEGIQQMKRSLDLLKRSALDLMQVHNLVDWKTHLKTIREWKETGKFRYIGVTHYQESAHAELEQILKTEPLDFLQINYNLANRKAADRLLPLAKDKNVAVIISQPFEYGKLFERVKGKKLPAWAADFDCQSWAQFFLKFILANPNVTTVIPGTGNPTHMLDNLMAGFGKLPDEKQWQMMAKEI